MDIDVLNPTLYRRLEQCFGFVKLSNSGLAASYKVARDPTTDRWGADFASTGEYYAVNCPYCGDTRSRLYINHLYGTKGPNGVDFRYLAVCYNDTACMSEHDNRDDLWDTLSQTEAYLSKAPIQVGTVEETVRIASMPGPCTPMNALDDYHKANQYLESRGFDPDYLTRHFGIAYCMDSMYFLARNRIIIPIVNDGVLRGWQARYVGELPWKDKSKKGTLPPKYFSLPQMQRRMLLYNIDRARNYHTGIVMEGPTDVWRLGPMGVCTFGASMSAPAFDKFISYFKKRTAVLVYDPDAYDSKASQKLMARFTEQMPANRFAAVRLPRGSDPGSLDRAFLRGYIADEAALQGVRVKFQKVI